MDAGGTSFNGASQEVETIESEVEFSSLDSSLAGECLSGDDGLLESIGRKRLGVMGRGVIGGEAVLI